MFPKMITNIFDKVVVDERFVGLIILGNIKYFLVFKLFNFLLRTCLPIFGLIYIYIAFES